MTRRRSACLLFATLFLLGLAAWAWSAEAAAKPAAAQRPVMTSSGPVTGRTAAGGVRAYLGIPYAAPPVGELRWRPPQPPKPWTKPRACTAFGPACPQGPPQGFRPRGKMDEDCLTLNVWTSAAGPGARQPVMVWIHGGGFVIGSGSMGAYQGDVLARRGVVVVTINYRLGPLGFLAHPALTAESPTKTSGNYGLMDQIHALKWVRRNIAAFGGHAGNVTIFGESAGGVSAVLLMASPRAGGLFHRAIMQSGSIPPRLRGRAETLGGLPSAESLGVEFARKLGAADDKDVLEAMRAKPWQEILRVGGAKIIMPGKTMQALLCIDGFVLAEPPLKTFAEGRQARVPFLAGSNADEGTIFTRRRPITLAAYRALAQTVFREHADRALELYPARSDAEAREAFCKVLGDVFVHGARTAVRHHAAVQPETYLYHFTRTRPWAKRLGLGCFHGAEIPYVFGRVDRPLMYAGADRQLSDKMMGYWVRFARTGNPNGGGAPNWPAYTLAADQHLTLDAPIAAGKHLRKAACDFLDQARSARPN